jgi:biopolymer transport protein ExbD
MAIVTPGRHPYFHPIGRLRKSPLKSGKKSVMAPLNLTAMVDMFTVIVIFLLQNFSASGELMFVQKNIELPKAEMAEDLTDPGPVVTIAYQEADKSSHLIYEGEDMATTSDIDDAEPGIKELTEQLTKVRENEEALAVKRGRPRDPTQPFDGFLIIQADNRVDFRLVRHAMMSVNLAGWTHIKFVTMPMKDPAAAAAEGHEG